MPRGQGVCCCDGQGENAGSFDEEYFGVRGGGQWSVCICIFFPIKILLAHNGVRKINSIFFYFCYPHHIHRPYLLLLDTSRHRSTLSITILYTTNHATPPHLHAPPSLSLSCYHYGQLRQLVLHHRNDQRQLRHLHRHHPLLLIPGHLQIHRRRRLAIRRRSTNVDRRKRLCE